MEVYLEEGDFNGRGSASITREGVWVSASITRKGVLGEGQIDRHVGYCISNFQNQPIS